MSTLLVSGGLLVDEDHVFPANVLIRDGRVAAITDTAVPADATLDVRGLHVLPGVVDAHVHFNEPGRTNWEGFLSGTSAAAAGGVTTVCDMPLNSDPPTLDTEALGLKRRAVASRAVVDYAFWGGVVPGSLAHLADLQRGGVVGVKAFLCDSGLPDYEPLDDAQLRATMRQCAQLGLLLALHAEQHAATRDLGATARAEDRRSAADWARSRPPETELEAVRQALTAARETGARVHFVHISTPAAARLVAAARADGVDATVETCPHYLVLDDSDLERLGGLAKCAPPLRDRALVDELWAAVLDGTLDLIASDHSPCPPRMKSSPDIWAVWGGIAGVQTALALLLDEGVARRGLPLPRLTSLLSASPARRLGLFPRKGTLQPGADADLVLVDLNRSWTVQASNLHTRWPLSPYLGRRLRGMVVATLVRGIEVYRAGRVSGSPGAGRPLEASA